MTFTLHIATLDDLDALTEVMTLAIEHLQDAYLTKDQVAASYSVMGLDTRLIEDGTYFLFRDSATNRIAGCGGWSRRTTLFGGDHSTGRDDAFLDPARDPARVRAMYTHPDFIRRGIGREMLRVCEDAARSEAFQRAELMATLSGVPLYEACGYQLIERVVAETPSGVPVPMQRMGKLL